MVGSVNGHPFVMPGLVPGIHVFFCCFQRVDGRDIQREDALLPGHDG
jgi:hypothetical protein